MKNSITIRDIAELANVSTATVSRVFSGKGYVDDETKEEILRISEENGFKPRTYKKREMDVSHDCFVGIVVADLNNVFFREIINAITTTLEGKGINVIVCDSRESVQQELHFLNVLLQLHADGIFISPVSENAEYNSEFLKDIYRSGVPVILIDRDVKGIGLDGVFQDNYISAINVVDMLIEQGHKNIAHIAGPITAKPGLDRLNGYIDGLKANHIPVRQEYIGYGDFLMESGYRLTKDLLEKHPELTAFYCGNDLMTVGCIRAIHDAGMIIPNDIAVISTGSLDQFNLYGESEISQVQLPSSIMGEECAKRMIERLDAKQKKQKVGPARRISFDCPLVLRGSEIYPVNKR